MFKTILAKLASLTRVSAPFDPACLRDPIAERTSWAPHSGGGSNFRTHRLTASGPDRIERRLTVSMVLFCLLFFSIGLGTGALALYTLMPGCQPEEPMLSLLLGLFCVAFGGVGGGLFWFNSRPFVFDRSKGTFWLGRTAPDQVMDPSQVKVHGALPDIHALQVLREHVHSSKNSYYSYELNLVLKDASRVNVMDHGNLRALRRDADLLAAFLGVPVWDATLE